MKGIVFAKMLFRAIERAVDKARSVKNGGV
jgi:hypothetical protein